MPSIWGWPTGGETATTTPGPLAQAEYCPQELPVPLRRAPVPPWVRELGKLLDSGPAVREPLPALRRVERALRTRTESPHLLSESLLRSASSELRWVARRSSPSPALARLLDRFENELVLPAVQRARARR